MNLFKKTVIICALFMNLAFLHAKDLCNDWTQNFHIKDSLVSESSSYQDITIFNNDSLGKILMLDNIVQYSEKDEFIYHEMLVHVPMMTHPNPKSILIIGGGAGACLREVLKHPSVEDVTVVEIDPMLVDLCKKHFKCLANDSFDDPRARLIIKDGQIFVKKTKKQFDLIIVNAADHSGPAKPLFKNQFYNDCIKILKPNGIYVSQEASPITQLNLLKKTHHNLRKTFKSTYFYYSAAPSHIGGVKAYSMSLVDPPEALNLKKLERRFKQLKSDVRFYDPDIHESAFYTPKYIDQKLGN